MAATATFDCRARGEEMAAAVAGGSGGQTCRGGRQLAGGPQHDAEVSRLAVALRDAGTAAAQLAARFRACATASREPAAYARAAAVTGAAQALGQAWQLIHAGMPGTEGRAGPARELADLHRPPAGPEETAQLLAGARLLDSALSALADRSAAAASHATQPPADCLASVQASLRAARQQLARALGLAAAAGIAPPPPAAC